MKTKDCSKKPTRDDIRAAWIAGFTAAIGHYSPEKQEQMLRNYKIRNARREASLERFRAFLGMKADS